LVPALPFVSLLVLTFSCLLSFSFYSYGHHRDLHSFLHDALPISNIPLPFFLLANPNPPPVSSSSSSCCCRSSSVITCTFDVVTRSEEHTSELQSRENLVCRLLLEKKNK